MASIEPSGIREDILRVWRSLTRGPDQPFRTSDDRDAYVAGTSSALEAAYSRTWSETLRLVDRAVCELREVSDYVSEIDELEEIYLCLEREVRWAELSRCRELER